MAISIPRLKKLVAYRERLEREEQRVLAVALQRRLERERALQESEQARHAYLASGIEAGVVAPEVLLSGARYSAMLERQGDARRAALAASDRELDTAREALLERRRDREAVEKLLERAIARAREIRERVQANRLDELGTLRWVRDNPIPGTGGQS